MIHKTHFTPKKLLSLVKRKFGVTFPPSTFWDRALLASKMLETIKPLLFGTADQQKNTIKKIQEFFEKESAKELRRVIR